MKNKEFNYSKEYSDFWSREERWGTSSFEDVGVLIDEIVKSCGNGSLLDVGCGMGELVKKCCSIGIDAYGVDVASEPIETNNKKLLNRFKQGSILSIPYEDNAFETLVTTDCLEHIKTEDVPKALNELYRVTKKNLYVRLSTREDVDSKWHLTIKNGKWWEEKLFEAGFRKHSAYSAIVPYHETLAEADTLVGLYEKIPMEVKSKYDMSFLEKSRTLHTDMTRESGVRSDGHIIRYFLATEFIQSGDRILDCACGLGYGSYLLANISSASEIVGVDITEEAIDYASANFSKKDKLLFEKGDAETLENYKNGNFDFITSFETLEHIPKPENFLEEAYRVLKPGGRIIVSVPNCWLNEEGRDPSPYHLHAYTWENLTSQIKKFFFIEKAWELTMDGYFKNGKSYSSAKKLREFAINSSPRDDTECILLLAMKDPLADGYQNYEETAWGEYGEKHKFVAFKQNYINPYIWKIVLSSPHRDVNTNIGFCERIISEYPHDSADYGGALCYLSYRLLESKDFSTKNIVQYINKIDSYLDLVSTNVHVYRWKISLSFVKAQLFLKIGDFSEGKSSLLKCTDYAPKYFSPTIATKIMTAYAQLALLDRVGEENNYYKQSLNFLQNLFVDVKWTDIFGDLDKPIPFGLKEMGEIFNIASNNAWHILLQDNYYGDYSKTHNIFNDKGAQKQKIYQLESCLLAKEKARQTLEKMLEEAVHEKENIRTELENIKNTISWKVTKPLRFLKKFKF